MTILLTSYNHRAYLPEAVESVRSQTFADYEVIVLDDGSTDGSREWLTEHASDWRLDFAPNVGTYAALNRGLDQASGEFVAILNDDDRWSPTKLADQVALFDAEPRLVLCGTRGYAIDETGDPATGETPGFIFDPLEPGPHLTEFILHNRFITSSVIFRRGDERFDPSYYGNADWKLWLTLLERGWAAKIPSESTHYRLHGTQASGAKERMLDERLRLLHEVVVERAMELMRLEQEQPGLSEALLFTCAFMGTEWMWRGDRSRARHAYRQAINLNPFRIKTWVRLAATCLSPTNFRRLN